MLLEKDRRLIIPPIRITKIGARTMSTINAECFRNIILKKGHSGQFRALEGLRE